VNVRSLTTVLLPLRISTTKYQKLNGTFGYHTSSTIEIDLFDQCYPAPLKFNLKVMSIADPSFRSRVSTRTNTVPYSRRQVRAIYSVGPESNA